MSYTEDGYEITETRKTGDLEVEIWITEGGCSCGDCDDAESSYGFTIYDMGFEVFYGDEGYSDPVELESAVRRRVSELQGSGRT